MLLTISAAVLLLLLVPICRAAGRVFRFSRVAVPKQRGGRGQRRACMSSRNSAQQQTNRLDQRSHLLAFYQYQHSPSPHSTTAPTQRLCRKHWPRLDHTKPKHEQGFPRELFVVAITATAVAPAPFAAAAADAAPIVGVKRFNVTHTGNNSSFDAAAAIAAPLRRPHSLHPPPLPLLPPSPPFLPLLPPRPASKWTTVPA